VQKRDNRTGIVVLSTRIVDRSTKSRARGIFKDAFLIFQDRTKRLQRPPENQYWIARGSTEIVTGINEEQQSIKPKISTMFDQQKTAFQEEKRDFEHLPCAGFLKKIPPSKPLNSAIGTQNDTE